MNEIYNLASFEKLLQLKIESLALPLDPAHDLLHFLRVVGTTKRLCAREGGKLEIAVPAAWLHDLVNVPKNDPRRSQASRLSAIAAREFLSEIRYPEELHSDISHAIEAHSFSAGIEAKTLEAKIVQDADRLDGLGAIGIARCFSTAGSIGRPYYSPVDPLCERRTPDDSQFTIDHFFKKLFKTAQTLQTQAAIEEGKKRVEFMRKYLAALGDEISC